MVGPLFWGLSGQKFDPGPIWLLGVAGEVWKPHKRIGNGQKPMFWPLMSLRSLYEGETATSPFLGVPPKSWIFGNHHFSSRSHRGTYEGSNQVFLDMPDPFPRFPEPLKCTRRPPPITEGRKFYNGCSKLRLIDLSSALSRDNGYLIAYTHHFELSSYLTFCSMKQKI